MSAWFIFVPSSQVLKSDILTLFFLTAWKVTIALSFSPPGFDLSFLPEDALIRRF